ncbi:MAG TPA: polymer-forming cytoskeletal protein [Candidatus Wirthbacteria bacterium]|nr:polymer-forming cytoskeletal protein [Candidatus Wirthbacteria bacterium]
MNKPDTNPEFNNQIGKGAKLKGDIIFDTDTLIDGRVEGSITINGFLHLGPNADIQASIQAEQIVCQGKIKGNINCSGTLRLASTSQITGDIQTHLLAIEEGAQMQAKVSMNAEKKQPELLKPLDKRPSTE